MTSKLVKVKAGFSKVPSRKVKFVAMTASCTESIKTDIEKHTTLSFDRVIWGDMQKPNIFIQLTVPKHNKFWAVVYDALTKYTAEKR
mmetsp:Transcript_15836/g.29970  ORF Transcript_15836/g.29970 Transcript_15836/m.29970 type:complete len:87 (+) Transcript_15836:871-1131(+)